MIIPSKLNKGDTIVVIAPSGAIEDEDILKINESIKLLEDFGFNVVFSENAYENDLGYGTYARKRADDINEMFSRTDIKAILVATGGFASCTTFDYLDYKLIRENPKILCGFSDATSIENVISDKCGIVTYSGPTLKSMTSWDTDYAYEQFIKKFAFADSNLFEEDDECFTIIEGNAEGELIGGNLSLIAKMCAGKHKINFDNKILFLEELYYEAPPGLVYENLYYLKQNGVFDKIKGIWLGNYEGEIPIEKVLFDVFENDITIPVIKSNNFGHTDKKMIIPIGVNAKIDTNEKIKIKLTQKIVN